MNDSTARPASVWVRRLPILVIVIVAVVGFFTLRQHLSFDALAEHRESLIAFRDDHYFWASLGFIGAYILIVAFSLPGATVATLTGGFLFGLFPGVVYNVTGATLGAIGIFLAARSGFGKRFADGLKNRGGGVAKLQKGLQENEFSVLLTMRLIPVVPFFVANLVPAFMGVRLSRFALTTALGIIPGALVFTSVGAGLGEVFAREERPDLSIIWSPQVLLPLLGLAVLSALPMVIKVVRKKDV